MSTAGRAPLRAFAHRRAPRCPLAVPVRVTTMRSGTAYSVSGRSVDLGEGGIAVTLPAEIRFSDPVAVEFLLPDLGLGLQAKAVVRYHASSHWGLEFSGLTKHQQAVIREWTRQRQSGPAAASPAKSRISRFLHLPFLLPQAQIRRVIWGALGILVLLGLIQWWRWEKAWKELEGQVSQPTSQLIAPAQPLHLLLKPTLRPGDPYETHAG